MSINVRTNQDAWQVNARAERFDAIGTRLSLPSPVQCQSPCFLIAGYSDQSQFCALELFPRQFGFAQSWYLHAFKSVRIVLVPVEQTIPIVPSLPLIPCGSNR